MDILLFAIIAGTVIFKLYRSFGEIGDDEINEHRSKKIQSINLANGEDLSKIVENLQTQKSQNDNPKIAKILDQIAEKDASFNEQDFLEKAEMVYEMIIKAYDEKDKKTLKGLLSKNIYEDFIENINADEKENLNVSTILTAIHNKQITDAGFDGKIASIEVEFQSMQINFTKNSNGDIVSGDVSKERKVKDVWKFERNIQKNDPAWFLVSVN